MKHKIGIEVCQLARAIDKVKLLTNYARPYLQTVDEKSSIKWVFLNDVDKVTPDLLSKVLTLDVLNDAV